MMFEVRGVSEGTVKLVGRLDAAEVDAARRALGVFPGPLVLDCAELDYISSAGIGLLVETYKRLNLAGHKLSLVNLLPRVRNIFAYAGLDRVLTLE